MENAKEELLSHIKDRKIKCASISLIDDITFETNKHILLPVNYTEEQYNKFLSELDFEYNKGYGSQEVFGYIWYNDNTWSSRGEYDGKEWWERNVMPEIPEELQ